MERRMVANHILKGIFLLAISLTFSVAIAQTNSDDYEGVTYARGTLFYETGSAGENMYGFEANINPKITDFSSNGRIAFGMGANIMMGYNFSQLYLMPGRADLAVWGAYQVNEKLSFGLQYCYLGVYLMQDFYFGGSLMSLAVRFKSFQLAYQRAGNGLLYGWWSVKNRDVGPNTNALELTWFAKDWFLMGARFNTYRYGLLPSMEYRLFAGVNINWFGR